MIRVLNIISDTNIGGAGRVLLNYLRYTDRNRFETLVALPRGSLLKPPLEEAGGRVLEVDGIADRSFDRGDIAVLRKLIRQEKPDLVHTHGCFSGRIAARREGVPVIRPFRFRRNCVIRRAGGSTSWSTSTTPTGLSRSAQLRRRT
jgi:hypothetical protein